MNAFLLPLCVGTFTVAVGCAVEQLYPLAALWLALSAAFAVVWTIKRGR